MTKKITIEYDSEQLLADVEIIADVLEGKSDDKENAMSALKTLHIALGGIRCGTPEKPRRFVY